MPRMAPYWSWNLYYLRSCTKQTYLHDEREILLSLLFFDLCRSLVVMDDTVHVARDEILEVRGELDRAHNVLI